MQTVDFNQLLEETDIVCVGCQSILKLKIVAEVIDAPDDYALGSTSETSETQIASSPEIPAPFEQEVVLQKDPEEALPDALQASSDEEIKTDYSGKGAEDRQKILLCIDGEASRELIQELLAETNYRVIDVPSGIAAFMSMKLERPDIALIDAGLTDMPGADLCSQIKSHEDLKDTGIILIGSMFEKNTRHRRQAPAMCGADDYIDRYHLQSELIPMIHKLLQSTQDLSEQDFVHPEEIDPPTPSTADELIPDATSEALPHLDLVEESPPEAQASSTPQADPEVLEKAERLARTIFSDIALYNVEKMAEGLRGDCLQETLEAEILEGRRLFESRVSSEIVASGCFEKTLEAFILREKEKRQAKKEQQEIEQLNSHPPEAMPLLQEPSMPGSETPSTEMEAPAATQSTEAEINPEEVESAKRLARIIVSDIAIYNEKKVNEGLKAGTFYSLLSEEIKEGRKLFEARVSERLPQRSEYFREALGQFIQRRQGAKSALKASDHPRPEARMDSKSEAKTEINQGQDAADIEMQVEVEKGSAHQDPFAEDKTFTENPSSSEAAEEAFVAQENPKAHENAKRLARIILSDIVIYNERKVDLGIRSGRFFEVLKEEISEGRRLYESRVSEKIIREENYFKEACNAFISKRRATAA